MKKLKQLQIILIGGIVLALAACSSHRMPPNQSAIDAANSAYGSHPGAHASGLGQESRFGDQGGEGGGERILAKRTYYFDYDSNVVHNEDKPAILANGDHLASQPRSKVMLEGHTDPRGSREYNIGLGERRAKAVATILIAKGANPGQIRVVSYGAEKPASPGRTEQAYQLDRRVVLVYLK